MAGLYGAWLSDDGLRAWLRAGLGRVDWGVVNLRNGWRITGVRIVTIRVIDLEMIAALSARRMSQRRIKEQTIISLKMATLSRTVLLFD